MLKINPKQGGRSSKTTLIMEYVIDNEHFADHLTPPFSTPPVFFNLTQYIDEETLSTLDSYLLSNDILHFAEQQKEGRVGIFPAEGKKHADCIELCDRDTSTWCQDVFRALNGKDDFRQCRGHRGDPKTWRPNTNAFLLPGVESFARKLPFFSQIGKIAIIINRPNDVGVEHADIGQNDLVSEFVWIRTKSSKKIFYVKDPVTNEKTYAPVGSCVGWFDDHLQHNIEPVNAETWSIRIDGRFTPEYRELLVENAVFGKQNIAMDGDEGNGLKGVLKAQTNGPVFLQRENDAPSESESESEEEEEEEEKEEDTNGEKKEDVKKEKAGKETTNNSEVKQNEPKLLSEWNWKKNHQLPKWGQRSADRDLASFNQVLSYPTLVTSSLKCTKCGQRDHVKLLKHHPGKCGACEWTYGIDIDWLWQCCGKHEQLANAGPHKCNPYGQHLETGCVTAPLCTKCFKCPCVASICKRNNQPK